MLPTHNINSTKQIYNRRNTRAVRDREAAQLFSSHLPRPAPCLSRDMIKHSEVKKRRFFWAWKHMHTRRNSGVYRKRLSPYAHMPPARSSNSHPRAPPPNPRLKPGPVFVASGAVVNLCYFYNGALKVVCHQRSRDAAAAIYELWGEKRR